MTEVIKCFFILCFKIFSPPYNIPGYLHMQLRGASSCYDNGVAHVNTLNDALAIIKTLPNTQIFFKAIYHDKKGNYFEFNNIADEIVVTDFFDRVVLRSILDQNQVIYMQKPPLSAKRERIKCKTEHSPVISRESNVPQKNNLNQATFNPIECSRAFYMSNDREVDGDKQPLRPTTRSRPCLHALPNTLIKKNEHMTKLATPLSGPLVAPDHRNNDKKDVCRIEHGVRSETTAHSDIKQKIGLFVSDRDMQSNVICGHNISTRESDVRIPIPPKKLTAFAEEAKKQGLIPHPPTPDRSKRR